MMRELGIMPDTAYGTEATNPTHNPILDAIKAAGSLKIADDDTAVAVIRNTHRAEMPNFQQDADNGDATSTPAQRIKDFCTSITENLAKYRQLSDKIAGGRLSSKSLRKQTEALRCQQDVEPGRVLLLLKDMLRQGMAERA
ncbi:MAG: hypothetical protein ACYSYV_00870 [Planctomycetota bacterium]|jgi:hypothetical protein